MADMVKLGPAFDAAIAAAFRRGAEAMRKKAINRCVAAYEVYPHASGRLCAKIIENAIGTLPIPEDVKP